ncbi:hypothetical protein [Calothrix sp. 336/3]|nr:hypothetical protein [Calothrix sp. 336/3]
MRYAKRKAFGLSPSLQLPQTAIAEFLYILKKKSIVPLRYTL